MNYFITVNGTLKTTTTHEGYAISVFDLFRLSRQRVAGDVVELLEGIDDAGDDAECIERAVFVEAVAA